MINGSGTPFLYKSIAFVFLKWGAPHFRHSKAMHLLRADVDLNYIRDFLGHVNTSTTEVYAKADAEMKRKALEKANFDVPLENQTTWQKNENLLS